MEISDGITNIPELALENCMIKSEDTITGQYDIKTGTRLIAGEAFNNCTALKRVTFPSGVKSIDSFALGNQAILKLHRA